MYCSCPHYRRLRQTSLGPKARTLPGRCILTISPPDGHAPYDENAMLFMDYRTDYVDTSELSEAELTEMDGTPTFLYAMPMGEAPNGRRRIFFEEVRGDWLIDPSVIQ